ncbi:hypothetical protein TSUD_75950, partial [Trifolium subterraneum]
GSNVIGVGEDEIFHLPNNNNKSAKKNTNPNKKHGDNNSNNSDGNKNKDSKAASDKRFKTLPPSESLPRNETIGGYIFVCNNDTMAENLKRQLFGFGGTNIDPTAWEDKKCAGESRFPAQVTSSIQPLKLLYGAAVVGIISPGGCCTIRLYRVRVITRKTCEPLEEDSFRPILHHYDGPKFRLELNVPEALSLLDIFEEQDTSNDSLKVMAA